VFRSRVVGVVNGGISRPGAVAGRRCGRCCRRTGA
jgi:hypothetical protein